MTNPIPFSQRPHDDRMAFRDLLDGLGVGRVNYSGDGLTVALPVGLGVYELGQACQAFGLEVVDDWQFSLGTDKPDASLRHVSWSYGGGPSCWHMAYLRPTRDPLAAVSFYGEATP